MEKKKITPLFFILSLINVIPAAIMGEGLTLDTLYFILAIIVLMFNHLILVKIVTSVTHVASVEGKANKHWSSILFLMLLKFCLLFGLVGLFYYYKKNLLIKLFLLIFFQLIIQVVSIKNNNQNS